MPTYEHEDNVARFADDLVGMSVSGLLSNQGIFHVKISPRTGINGELFAFYSPVYQTHLIIKNGFVEFRRNDDVAKKEIGPIKSHVQILLSWMPDRFQLALKVDDDIDDDGTCITIETNPLIIPISLLKWARQFNLISRKTYDSPSDFLGVFLENIRQANQKIKKANAFRLFWDKQNHKGAPNSYIPKREPDSMSGIVAFLQDQSLLSGYELIPESSAGAGILDLRALASLSSGGFINICVEGKNAHSNDLAHGLTNQLPEYMKSMDADYGVYLVLWYKCDSFQKPNRNSLDVTLELSKVLPMKTIVVEKFDLSIPLSPSKKKFK